MKPLISYYGGKGRLASRIVPILESIPHTVYCEPFFGGGAVFYARQKPRVSNNNHYREIINDHSEHLITLYRWARDHAAEFERMIEFTPYSQSEYRRAIEVLRDESASERDIAWAYYTNIQQSFSNKLDAGWGRRVASENGAATWHNKRLRIPACLERLQDVHIACDDALKVIEPWDSPQTLYYLDPPYPGTECGHYSGYSLDDWARLCDLLDNCQGSYVLSNYPQEIEPKSAQQRIEIKATSSASGEGKCASNVGTKRTTRSRAATADELGNRERTEVLWVCDRSHAIRDDLGNALHKQANPQLDLFSVTTS